MEFWVFLLCAIILIFIVIYYQNSGAKTYKYVAGKVGDVYNKYAPYSYKKVREKIKELGQDYTPKQYLIQVLVFSLFTFLITYLYFYNIVVSIIYIIIVLCIIPYLTYLRSKRLFSEFIFEQIQVYTTNVIMEFATTQSFVKALEGVRDSGVLEDPVKSDVDLMITMAYENGTIEQSIEYMNKKYDYYIVRNMHQLFLQITNEGSSKSNDALENMSLDIDMLVEGVYRDRIDRQSFHKKFIQFGLLMYLIVMLMQFLLGHAQYIALLDTWWVVLILHAIIIINSYFLLNGEKYYNEDVGAE